MLALVLEDFNRLEVLDRDLPSVGADEILIKVAAVGICGSDVHGFTGHNGRRQPGQVMGHEAAGTVAAGPGFEVGQPVTFNPMITCGTCAACTADQPQQCPRRKVIGVDPEISAAFAEFVAVPRGNVVALPDRMPVQHGALIEPLAVAFNAVSRGRIAAGDRVLVVGGGPIGQSCVLAAKAAGATSILVSEPNAGRREVCGRLGAQTVDPTNVDLAEQVVQLLGGSADVAIDAVGVTVSLQGALAGTKVGGRVVLVGMGRPTLELDAFAVSTMERSLIGSFGYTRTAFATAAAWAGEHPDELPALVSSEVRLDQAAAAFAQLAGTEPAPGKILVRIA